MARDRASVLTQPHQSATDEDTIVTDLEETEENLFIFVPNKVMAVIKAIFVDIVIWPISAYWMNFKSRHLAAAATAN